MFSSIQMNKRILCITILLGLSNEDDYRVKAGAVRALGAYVLYPCLREVRLLSLNQDIQLTTNPCKSVNEHSQSVHKTLTSCKCADFVQVFCDMGALYTEQCLRMTSAFPTSHQLNFWIIFQKICYQVVPSL